MKRQRIRTISLLTIALFLASTACKKKTEEAPTDTSRAVSTFPIEMLGRFYQAGGHLEMDQPNKAAPIYEDLLKHAVNDPAVLANLAVCKISMQAYAEAATLARKAASLAPQDPEIAVIHAAALASINQHDEALRILRELVKKSPADAVATYALIVALENQGNDQFVGEIAEHYDALLRLVPKNIAALLATARAEAISGDLDAAMAHFDRCLAIIGGAPEAIERFVDQLPEALASNNAAAVRRTITVTRNIMRGTDRYRADILALGPVGDKVPAPLTHPIAELSGPAPEAIKATIAFEQATDALGLESIANDSSVQDITFGTVSADRRLALYVCRKSAPGRLLVWREDRFEDLTSSYGLHLAAPAGSALFVDINNDRWMDLLLLGDAGVALYVNQKGERFVDATATNGLADCGASVGAVPFDYDHDGDLDLIRWNAKGLRVHQNDGEGRLTDIGRLPGIPGDIADIHAIEPLDLDDDGDIDLCITIGNGPFDLRIFSNERLATFREVTDRIEGLHKSAAAEPLIADLDHNGKLEIIDPATGGGIEIGTDFATRRAARLGAAPAAPSHLPASAIAADFDCDGRMDVLRVFADGSTDRADVKVAPGSRLFATDIDRDGLVDLLSSSGRVFLNKSTNTGNWLAVSLAALISGDSRFNSFGLGSTIEIRAGVLYGKRHVTGPTTHFGLGPYTHADVLRVVWPNGNYQNLEFRASSKMNLAANQLVIEEQTLKGSCPYLYAWTGERFEFVTDVLWRSALGMFIMTDVIAHHGTADDYFKITSGQLAPLKGEYVLQFTEELWETAYFDYCRLFVVDHPIGTDVFVDEKCIPPPYPPFKIHKARQMRPVLQAFDHSARDVTELLARRDNRYVAGFELTRYQGIVKDHDLIMDLGPFDNDAPVSLFMSGWLWPTDASTNLAISQNPRVRSTPPTLSVVDHDGEWKKEDLTVGFPSGKNKTIILDLSGRFATSDHRVKISTNFAIFWDHVFCTVGAQDFDMTVTELPVSSADLHYRGFSHEFPRVPHGPTIPDYNATDPDRQWRDMVGDYTRCGDVTELLGAADSMYAIVGAGDEVTLRFVAAEVPPLRDGWRRDFIIHTDGWLKDGDLNSATGKTIAPLPFHGMSAFPYPASEAYPDTTAHQKYVRTYNTRHRDQKPFHTKLRNR